MSVKVASNRFITSSLKGYAGFYQQLLCGVSNLQELGNKLVYAIESVNRGLRKVIKNRGSFPNDEAALKLIYLALGNISQKWTKPIKEWKAALNRFAIVFEGRLPI